jgi:hypothetical protein
VQVNLDIRGLVTRIDYLVEIHRAISLECNYEDGLVDASGTGTHFQGSQREV